MGLDSRIAAKLAAGIDDQLFERCAVTLMGHQYDGVVPIEGGSDGGRDADILAPVAKDPDSRGRVLVTTGDALDNVKRSHKTWTKFWNAGEAFRIDLLVIVTSRVLSNAKRRSIEAYCSAHSLPTPHIYSRQWLIDALRREPELRAELTGVRGRLEALSERGPDLSTATDLLGRTQELQQLALALDASVDAVLFGVAGVGKSRVLSELNGSVHYVEPLARASLLDDILAIEPDAVALDDAQANLELLRELVLIRAREQLTFSIVAATWPNELATVEAVLASPITIEVDRLERATIDQFIQTLGVRGVRARTLVLDQADGRPGWAELLARTVVATHGDSQAVGQALLDQVASLTVSIPHGAVVNEALACIAALGSASPEDLEVIANQSGVPYADLFLWLEMTARGGLTEWSRGQWSALEPLRSLIVASTFFGERKRRDWAPFASRFPDDVRLTRSLLKVAARVRDPEVRRLVDAWFDEVSGPGRGDVPAELVALYAAIDETSADRAAALARTLLAANRVDPDTDKADWGSDATDRGAREILKVAFLRSCSQEAARGLFDLALLDHRPRPQNPDHPMRHVESLAKYLDPDLGPIDELRPRILRYAIEWFDASKSHSKWRILTEVVSYVFDPHLEGSWGDPGSHRSFVWSRGLMAPEAMDILLDLWSDIDERVKAASRGELDRDAVRYLCSVFDEWSGLSVGVSSAGVEVGPAHLAQGLRGASHVLGTLTRLSAEFPGVPLRVNQRLGVIHAWSESEPILTALQVEDHRLAKLVGQREPDDDIEEWMSNRRADHSELATEVGQLAGREGVEEFERLMAEAAIVAGGWGHDGFVWSLARQVLDAEDWLLAAVEAEAVVLVGPLISRALVSGSDLGDLIADVSQIAALRSAVFRAIVTNPGPVDATSAALLAALTPEDVLAIGDLWFGDTDTAVLAHLLDHQEPVVRSWAALSADPTGRGTHGPTIPTALAKPWRKAIISATPGTLPQHSRWRLKKIVEQSARDNPDLCADWIIAGSSRLPNHRERLIRHEVPRALDELPRAQKERVIEAIGVEGLLETPWASSILASDADLAMELVLHRGVSGRLLSRALSGYRDSTVEVLLPALLAAELPTTEIVAAVLGNRGWSGDESAALEEDIRFFSELASRRPEFARVCESAQATLETEKAAAKQREAQERIRGW